MIVSAHRFARSWRVERVSPLISFSIIVKERSHSIDFVCFSFNGEKQNWLNFQQILLDEGQTSNSFASFSRSDDKIKLHRQLRRIFRHVKNFQTEVWLFTPNDVCISSSQLFWSFDRLVKMMSKRWFAVASVEFFMVILENSQCILFWWQPAFFIQQFKISASSIINVAHWRRKFSCRTKRRSSENASFLSRRRTKVNVRAIKYLLGSTTLIMIIREEERWKSLRGRRRRRRKAQRDERLTATHAESSTSRSESESWLNNGRRGRSFEGEGEEDWLYLLHKRFISSSEQKKRIGKILVLFSTDYFLFIIKTRTMILFHQRTDGKKKKKREKEKLNLLFSSSSFAVVNDDIPLKFDSSTKWFDLDFQAWAAKQGGRIDLIGLDCFDSNVEICFSLKYVTKKNNIEDKMLRKITFTRTRTTTTSRSRRKHRMHKRECHEVCSFLC